MDWVYKQIIGFLANFFAEMGNMGAEMFEMSWVQSIVLFFSYLAWILYAVGFVVACAECGLEYSSGRADIKGTAMNLIKGFMAVSLFSVVPVKLYELCVSLQANFGYAISGAGASFGTVAGNIIDELTVENFVDFATTHVGGFGSVTSPIMVLFCIILMAYAVIKVFFANLKRGGILLIQIAVGSLYMFSVPRGYLDGFYQWCKQVVGLCLTAFLQATILIAGLSLFNEHALLRSPVGKFPRRPQPLRGLLLAFSVLRGGGEDLLQIPHDLGLRAAGDMQVLSDLPDILFFHLASSVC